MKRRSLVHLVRSWIVTLTTFLVLYGVSWTFTSLNDGLGVVRYHGRFVLRQGAALREIDQLLGGAMFHLHRILLPVGALVLLLTAVVFATTGRVRPRSVIEHVGSNSELLIWSVRAALAFLTIPMVITFVRIFSWS